MSNARSPIVRLTPDSATIHQKLGLLKELVGTWKGTGFNLVARPFFGDATAAPPEPPANLFLELNLTEETLAFTPISSAIPNRGTFQPDITLYGLTYLQKISDATTGGALHIEPGIWITTTDTLSAPPVVPPPDGQIIARMGSIPHGNALLAGGAATRFSGIPVVGAAGGVANPAGSIFPSFNSSPIPVPATGQPLVIRAAGTQESLGAPAGGFSQYNLGIPASFTSVPPNPRTPLGNPPVHGHPPVLPAAITQAALNDPILFLQNIVAQQAADGCTFETTVLNIATAPSLVFFQTPPTAPPAGGPTLSVNVADSAGGTENLPFLETNADAALVYATFWIQRVTPKDAEPFMQLQYAQFVLLNFPAVLIPSALPPPQSDNGKLNFSWPHVSVATLHKTFP
jgi:hypothetical protein